MKSIIKSLPILLVFLIQSCAQSPTGRGQLKLLPEGQVAALGKQSFGEMKRKEKISADLVLRKRIECIAQRLISVMDKDNRPKEWEIEVFEDKIANAFALPGKKIGVYTGIIELTENDSQLAAIIGHEIGHVIANHGNERMSQNLLVQGGLIAADIGLNDLPLEKKRYTMLALGIGSQLGVLLPYSRLHENEADIIGIRLMAKAGFEPRQASRLWELMSQKGSGSLPEFLSTHPSNQNRIERLQDEARKLEKTYLTSKGKFKSCS